MPKTRRTADQWQALLQQHDQSPLSTAELCSISKETEQLCCEFQILCRKGSFSIVSRLV